MKYTAIIALISLSLSAYGHGAATSASEPASAPKTKKVCILKKDEKTKVEKEVCRKMKTHKKLNSTPVPEKK